MIPFLARLFRKAPEQPKPQEPPHIHSFELIAKTIAEPSRILLKSPDGFIPGSAVVGCTTYLWECSDCGQLRKEQLLGSEESTLATILQKVDEQGPVGITREGKKYLVGVVEEEKPLPIR